MKKRLKLYAANIKMNYRDLWIFAFSSTFTGVAMVLVIDIFLLLEHG